MGESVRKSFYSIASQLDKMTVVEKLEDKYLEKLNP